MHRRPTANAESNADTERYTDANSSGYTDSDTGGYANPDPNGYTNADTCAGSLYTYLYGDGNTTGRRITV